VATPGAISTSDLLAGPKEKRRREPIHDREPDTEQRNPQGRKTADDGKFSDRH